MVLSIFNQSTTSTYRGPVVTVGNVKVDSLRKRWPPVATHT